MARRETLATGAVAGMSVSSMILIGGALCLVGACGGADSTAASSDAGAGDITFSATALATVPSDAGKLAVEIRTAPYPHLVAGLQSVELVVRDPATGATVDGLTVTLTPWMTAMGHGASVTPSVTALGQGRYVFTNVSLFMPGEWQLRTQFSGPVSDSVEPTFNVD
jgi:hypothetical protein